MKKLLCILFCLLSAWGGKAQTLYRDQIRVDKLSVTRSDDNCLTVHMNLILQEKLELASNNSLTLTPYLEAEGRTKTLPSIMVYGRKRQLVNQRNNRQPELAYAVIRR